jgi:hypothetical protein
MIDGSLTPVSYSNWKIHGCVVLALLAEDPTDIDRRLAFSYMQPVKCVSTLTFRIHP